MELVEGRSLKDQINAVGPMDVDEAVEIAIETCRALADVHDLGVVHRDVKPANILLAARAGASERPPVKLCDFGIARPMDSADDSGLTRAGAAPGTPWYMAPEQCRSGDVDVRADVYALGATLFHALAGEPPFPDREPAIVISGHLNDPPPDIRALRPQVENAIAAVIARALEKDPENRYADGRDMLADLERAHFGERASIDLHPLPSKDGGKPSVYRFEWRLSSPPEELWPYVSDTERFNRAVGLSAVQFEHRPGEDGVETEAKQRVLGMVLEWREHPFEWIAPRRLGVLREHRTGPFVWIRSTVDLESDRGGTRLVHTVEAAPRGPVGRAAASLEIGVRLRRAFGRVYQRIDETCVLAKAAATAMGRVRTGDPYEERPQLSILAHRRLELAEDRLLTRGNPPKVVEALVEHVREGTPQQVAHIRPIALAHATGVDPDAMVRACLWASQEGALELLWDIVCPACRIPSSIAETLSQLEEHAHCDACDIDFELDLARSVELVFRAHATLRQSDSATYCIGGPAHSPHVLSQVRLAPGERFHLDPDLVEGTYRLAGRWSDKEWAFTVERNAPHAEWHLRLGQGLSPGIARSIRPGRARVLLENDLSHEAVVRLERGDGRAHAFTAAHAASHPLFRELFPSEVLSKEQLVGVSHIAIVVAEAADAARLYREGRDGRAFRQLVELRERVEEAARREGGTLVKLFGNGVLAVFNDNRDALRTALSLHDEGDDMRVVAHAGAAMMTTIDGRLDYFGRLMHEAQVFSQNVDSGELLVSEALIVDPRSAELFAAQASSATIFVEDGLLANRVRSSASEVA
jgi:class 3 adenylate cyclase